MAGVKAIHGYEDMVVLRPREDLDRKWASSTIIIPDTALIGTGSLALDEEDPNRRDVAAIAEVVHIGPGSAECPDLKGVSVGDIVVIPLYGASKILVMDQEMCLFCKFSGLAGIIRNLGQPNETLEAVNNYVLTRRDREAFERIMCDSMIMPEAYLSDGWPCDPGDPMVRVLLERVVHQGGGLWETDKGGRVRLNPKLRRGTQPPGELVGFNPLAAGCRFRRFGTWYHLVPYEDIQFGYTED